ncbi:MAG: protein TolR [Betaproteobacteria bacterium RIFCSPHIGHO2_12_FULL_69_13]|nr:MAG: protein TolR [Betaproteobacteria bacterium RIFCSPHIGHO2_12_FULL_69_13]OGA66285.1 MAG: protein TolR [Betaproteobacteria bacterium RIFCSPLOWO2_12_FULL_68_20]
MPSLHRRRSPMHEINIVPYVDVMLVLLVIFMVTAPLVTPGVIELPSVSKASIAPVAPLEVVIREDRTVLLRSRDAKGALAEERRVARGELAKLVRERQAANPDQPVLIAADKNVRYEAVLQVMDELQRERVKRVGLVVKPAQ